MTRYSCIDFREHQLKGSSVADIEAANDASAVEHATRLFAASQSQLRRPVRCTVSKQSGATVAILRIGRRGEVLVDFTH